MAITTYRYHVPKPIRLAGANNHLLVLGQVIHAENTLHDAFFRLFTIALALQRPDDFVGHRRFRKHALSIWHVIQSDKYQREMAYEAISTIPANIPLADIIKRLDWARACANTLATYRNVLAHNPVMMRPEMKGKKIIFRPEFGGLSTKEAHGRRLTLIKGLKLWRMIAEDFFKLSEYVEALNAEIGVRDYLENHDWLLPPGFPMPSLRKPRLRSLPHLQAIDRQLSTQENKRKPKRRNRRPSSPG